MKLFGWNRKNRTPQKKEEPEANLPRDYVFSPPEVSTPSSSENAYQIPVVVVKYFPVSDGMLDRKVTGDVGGPLEAVRRHTEDVTQRVSWALETGSTYHGYNDPLAQPSRPSR